MLKYEVIRLADRLSHVANEISTASLIALDLETTGLSPFDSEIRICSINTGQGVYVIDLFETKTFEPVLQSLRTFSGITIGQNLKFDCRFLLHKYGLELNRIFDTYRASAIINNGKDIGNNLYDLYGRELNMGPQAPDLGGSDWSGPLTEQQYMYAAEDVIFLPLLREKLKVKLAEASLNAIALMEFNAINPEAHMEMNGFYLDADAWKILAKENIIEKEKLRKKLIAKLPAPKPQVALPGFEPDFNLDSPLQLLASLQLMGLKVPDSKETTLSMLSTKYPILDDVIEYRGIAQAVKSFGLDYLENINSRTGRIHTSYYPFLVSGRYSCSHPNLQQLPRDKRFRECFKAAPGKKLVIADYSQIELRIAAEFANDATMIQAYRDNQDIHALTASIVSDKPIGEVTKKERQLGKPINFGLIYGLMPPKLVIYAKANYGVVMTQSEAKKFWSKYFNTYSGIRGWHERALRDGKRTGESRSLAGRRRFMEEDAYNEFYNNPVQSTGADGLKASLSNVSKRLKKYDGKAKMVHMVHDEIILEADDDKELLEAVRIDLEEGMKESIQPYLKKVPVVVEGGIASNWSEK